MSQVIYTEIPTAEILLASTVLREVGFDEEADKFKASLYDREMLPEAITALEVKVRMLQADASCFAKEAAFRMFQRLRRNTSPR